MVPSQQMKLLDKLRMNMKRLVALAIIINLSFGVFSQNQPLPQPKVLTFDDAIKIALRNGMLLNQQKNNLELSRMQKTSAIASLGPSISSTIQAYQTNGNSFIQQQGVVNGTVDAFSAFLNANVTLFNGFSQINRIRQTSQALDAQLFYVNRTAQDIISAVAIQYLTLLLDKELIRIAKENLTAQEKLLLQIQEQVKLGARSPVDEYNQLSQTKAAELRFLQTKVTMVTDRTSLAVTLLLDDFEDVEFSKPDWDINELNSRELQLEELYRTSLDKRGDYLRAKANERAAKFNMDVNRALMMPTLSGFAGYGSAYNKQLGDTSARSFSDQFRTDNVRKQYGFQLNIPIFNGLQNRAIYVQQRVAYLNSKVTTQNAEILVKTDVFRAYQNFQLYKQSYSVTLDLQKAAEVALEYELERYNLGVTSFVEYANANRVLVQAQTDKAQAEYRLLFQKVVIDYATGTLKPEDFN
jgi:outer membrane protein